MKKTILFYTKLYDVSIEDEIPELKKYLKEKGYSFETSIICKNPMLAEKFKIMVSPALIILVNNEEKDRLIGTPKDMLNHIKKEKIL